MCHFFQLTLVDIRVPFREFGGTDAKLGFNLAALVTSLDIVELVAVRGKARLSGLMRIRGRSSGDWVCSGGSGRSRRARLVASAGARFVGGNLS